MEAFREYLATSIRTAVNEFIQDVEALSHENLSKVWGGAPRCAYDFIYETALVNQRVAVRLRGEDPGPAPWKFGEGWLQAPAEMHVKEAAIAFVRSTGDELLASLGDDMERIVSVGDQSVSAYDQALMAVQHTNYHDAQLNFIQAMAGDHGIHWI